jgi:hypothetical protein
LERVRQTGCIAKAGTSRFLDVTQKNHGLNQVGESRIPEMEEPTTMPILRHYRKIDEFSIITAEAASIPSLEF